MEHLKSKRDGLLIFSDYKKTPFKILYGLMVLIIMIAIIVTVFPPIWLFLSSFKSAAELDSPPFTLFPEKFKLSKVVELWNWLQFGRYYLNSLWLILGALFCSILFNGLLAYAISIVKPVGHKIVFTLVMISLMVPVILNMGPLLQNIRNVGMTGTYLPLWLVHGANPFYFILFKVYFDQLPKTLFEQAQLDGCTKFQMFRKIVVPLSRPIVMVVSIFTVNAAWSDFLLPYLVLSGESAKQPVMVMIYSFYDNLGRQQGLTLDRLLMIISISIIPTIIFFIIFQKQITSSVATTGIKE